MSATCYCKKDSISLNFPTTHVDGSARLQIVEKGNMVFTPPLVEHCMKFPEDTLFLTLSRNPRDQETYELDVIRTNLIDPSNSISWNPED